jgi:hypothetical protein
VADVVDKTSRGLRGVRRYSDVVVLGRAKWELSPTRHFVVSRQPRILCASVSTCADVLSGDVMRSAVVPFNTARNPPALYAASPSPDTFVAVGTAASPAANVEAVSLWNTTLIGIAPPPR